MTGPRLARLNLANSSLNVSRNFWRLFLLVVFFTPFPFWDVREGARSAEARVGTRVGTRVGRTAGEVGLSIPSSSSTCSNNTCKPRSVALVEGKSVVSSA